MDGTAVRRNIDELVDDAERGLARKEFFFVYQPKLRIETGLLSGFESLIRWHHPEHGVLMPAAFIHLVENSHLTSRFSDYAIVESVRVLASWAALGYGELSLSVNLPAREITRSEMAGRLAHVLDSYGVCAGNLQIELTESIDPGPIDALAAAVTSIRDLGVSVAIDDFGSGCWSLTKLHCLAVDTLKLDRSFMRDVHENPESRAMVETLVELGGRLKKKVVVEGVETRAQFEWLKAMAQIDCQGYYISEPIREEQMDGLIERCGIPR
ncbi:EAL domain-containing protein [Burkholderia lata]|uniref:EAL domain-containing protein n=1 Tax=Burkholderia lata (strain ATCC 17760 / DSM 23089 / LMG 22485 / NCIMB 9086 / R18194 / 383) TaxID=482957 RepID=UPI001581700F|nr:EAL domain-containing protein [Burkholderia lata]